MPSAHLVALVVRRFSSESFRRQAVIAAVQSLKDAHKLPEQGFVDVSPRGRCVIAAFAVVPATAAALRSFSCVGAESVIDGLADGFDGSISHAELNNAHVSTGKAMLA